MLRLIGLYISLVTNGAIGLRLRKLIPETAQRRDVLEIF